MSRKREISEAMMPTPETGEKFMAIILWAQSSSCSCPACAYLRDMAQRLVQTHVPEVKSSG